MNTGREIYRWSIYRSFHNNIKNDLVVHKWNKITPSTLWSKVDHSTIFGDKVLAPRSKGSSKEHTKYIVNAYLRLTIPTLRSIPIWMIDIHHSLNYIRKNAESRVSIILYVTVLSRISNVNNRASPNKEIQVPFSWSEKKYFALDIA